MTDTQQSLPPKHQSPPISTSPWTSQHHTNHTRHQQTKHNATIQTQESTTSHTTQPTNPNSKQTTTTFRQVHPTTQTAHYPKQQNTHHAPNTHLHPFREPTITNNRNITLPDGHTLNTPTDHTGYIGTPPPDLKPTNTFRIYHTNPNGLTIHETQQCDLHEHCLELNHISADVCAFSEINLDTHKHNVRKIIHHRCKQIFHHYRLSLASSTIPSTNIFKPGGTMIITRGPALGRIINTGSDVMGRWSYQTFVAKHSSP